MSSRLLSVLRAPAVRVGFTVLALVLAVLAVARERHEVVDALARMGPANVAGSVALSAGYVVLTMLAWRAVLRDLGSPLPLAPASALFFVSQLGKYVPGGIWNVVAAAELGTVHRIPRRRSLSAMAVALLISVVTGLGVAAIAFGLGPDAVRDRYGWVLWSAPFFVALLAPPVLNRVLAAGLRLVHRQALEHPLTPRGTMIAGVWSVLAWLVAGAQVWVLATGAGMRPSAATFALACGAYALAWIVGFLVIIVPAGLGAREAVLLTVLAGQLSGGAILGVVLVSRAALTLVDVVAGLVAIALTRASSPGAAQRPGVPAGRRDARSGRSRADR
jgi:uncharacterized membrane protein YbhN (UPF0104 family)